MKAPEIRQWIPLLESCRLPATSGIYVIRHIESGKEYVGLSSNIKKRAARHRRSRKNPYYFKNALTKHGLVSFEIMIYCLSAVEDLNRIEVQVIAERNTLAPAGYNLTVGGEGTVGVKRSEETRARIRAARLGTTIPADVRAKIAEAGRGRVPSEATRRKIGDKHRGKVVSADARAKISTARLNKVWTAEEIERHAAGQRGRVHSADTRAKISEASANSRPVLVWAPGSLTPMTFPSASEAGRHTGEGVSQVSRYCLGTVNVRKACKYLFAYVE